MKVVVVDENNFKEEVLKEKKVLVDFNATWCGPCRMLKPILDEYSEITNIKICSIDVDNSPNLASKYSVYSIPCLIILENGIETKRNIGFLTLEELKEFINE